MGVTVTKQILVVEDDPRIADLLRLHLEEAGYAQARMLTPITFTRSFG